MTKAKQNNSTWGNTKIDNTCFSKGRSSTVLGDLVCHLEKKTGAKVYSMERRFTPTRQSLPRQENLRISKNFKELYTITVFSKI